MFCTIFSWHNLVVPSLDVCLRLPWKSSEGTTKLCQLKIVRNTVLETNTLYLFSCISKRILRYHFLNISGTQEIWIITYAQARYTMSISVGTNDFDRENHHFHFKMHFALYLSGWIQNLRTSQKSYIYPWYFSENFKVLTSLVFSKNQCKVI